MNEARVDQESRGLTATAALNHLRLRPGQNIDFLARLLQISHPAAVRLVDRLESEGLVERRADREDARSRKLVLTRAGQRAAVAAATKRFELLDEILAPLTAAERRRLEPLLEKLLAGLTSDRWDARHICRLCDIPTCESPSCPVDKAVVEPGLSAAPWSGSKTSSSIPATSPGRPRPPSSA
jgi:MarR family transcriptional regulator, negative regulator of the multidrug operon emrRAB